MKTYDDAVKLLTSSEKFRISLGLERIEKIMEILGNPQDRLNCIHVAGTNGKGSVCAVIASILNEAGIKVGVYSSPHIFKYTERIKTNSPRPLGEGAGVRGQLLPIPDNILAQYVFEISELADKNNIDLTEFEILTAVMFKYFADNGAEVVVLETGMGGRFDATNIIKKNLCSVITHIDYDHTERLGKTLDEIAFEKAGIIKPNCPCIVLEGMEAFYDKAMEIGAELEIVSPLSLSSLCSTPHPNPLPLGEGAGNCCGQGDMLALKGVYQQENLSLALAVIERCFPQIGEGIIKKGLQNVKHPCRFEYIKDKNLIIDGAHNPNGIKGLVESLDMYYPNTKRRFIFGCLRNKEYAKMVNEICKNNYVIASPNESEGVAIQPFNIQNKTSGLLRHSVPRNDMEIYFYHFNHQNSATYDELKAVCPVSCKELTKDTKIDFNDGYLNIICGSFYMLSELLELLKISPDSL